MALLAFNFYFEIVLLISGDVCPASPVTCWLVADGVTSAGLGQLAPPSESLSHGETSPTTPEPLARSVGGPAGWWIEHGTDGVLVPESGGGGTWRVGLFIYIFIDVFIPSACNGWAPWLRLLRGRCSITHEGVPLLGMAGPGPIHRPSRVCASCECQM